MILLPNATVEVFTTDGRDEHGWALSSPTRVWGGEASFQPGRYPSSATASDRGGRGPFDPAGSPVATLYVGSDAIIAPGMTVTVDSTTRWVVDSVFPVKDPTSSGLDCQVAAMTELVVR